MATSVLLSFGVVLCICQSLTAFTIVKLDDNSENTLQASFIIFRHGDRNPLFSYPTDPHRNYSWPGGYQALTPKGVLQAFELGSLLREKYSSLLSNDNSYSFDDMHVISSSIERTIMSAQSLLAGFLPPSDENNLLPIPWQPIPVHTLAFDKDTMLLQSRPCLKYYEQLRKITKNPPKDFIDMIQHVLTNETLYEYLSRHAGFNVSNAFTLTILYDILAIEENNGLELPEWTNIVSPKKMKSIIERAYAMFTENNEMKRLRAGPLLTEIAQSMQKIKANRLMPNRKLFFYSGHDMTLLSMIRALDIEQQTSKTPDYASALAFELHRSTIVHNELEVKLFYYPNSDVHEPTQVSIPNCYEPCILSEFMKIVKPYFVLNYDRDCKIRQIANGRFVRW